MSKETYGSYILSEMQRSRLEKERKTRLEEERLRIEAERRKVTERRRKEEVKAQKERIAALRSFNEKADRFKLKETRINDPTVAATKTDHPDELQRITGIMKAQLQSFPREWLSLLSPEIIKHKLLLAEVESECFDRFHSRRLYWAQRELNELLAKAPALVEEIYSRAAEVVTMTETLLAKLKVAERNTFFKAQQVDAASLIAALEALLKLDDKRRLVDDFTVLKSKAISLLMDFEEVQKLDQGRRFVMSQVCEVLNEMGYRTASMPGEDEKARFTEIDPLKIFFSTPENRAMEMAFGLDESIHGEFLESTDNSAGLQGIKTGEDNFVFDCEQFCQDYSYLLKSLAQKGIIVNEKWRVPPSDLVDSNLNVSDKLPGEEEQFTRERNARRKW